MSHDTKRPTKVTTSGELEIHIEREFDAPKDLVFRLYTDATKLPEFWGPRQYETIVEAWELQIGGRWHIIHRGEGGEQHEFYGEFREVNAPDSLTWTFEYGGYPGHVSVETITFTAIEGDRTRINVVSVFDNVEDRDGMVQSGMESGVVDMFERFDELLEREG